MRDTSSSGWHGGDLRFWLVSTRKAGHINQCRALLDALGVTAEREILIAGKSASDAKNRKRLLNLQTTWQVARALLTNRLPRNTVVLSSGRSPVRLCWLWQMLCGRSMFLIHVGEPETGPAVADLFIGASYQAEVRGSDPASRRTAPVLTVDGVLARKLGQPGSGAAGRAPSAALRLAVLVGGKNITFDYDGPQFLASLDKIGRILAQGDCSVDFVLSRRTFERTAAILRDRFSGTDSRVIEVADREGFATALAEATHLLVCPDSVTMISECCSIGKPVYILEMDRMNGETKNGRFLDSFLSLGYVRKLADFDPSASTRKLEDQAEIVSGPVKAAIQRWAGLE